MPKSIKGSHCKPGLPFSKILKKWIALNVEITEQWAEEKDVPWWYNERAALSVLTGAVWLTKNLAFEEFVDDKHKRLKKGKKKHSVYKGRVDLYANIDSQNFIAEAKQCWSGASIDNPNSINRILKILNHAAADIRKSYPNGQRRLAMVFVVPSIQKSHQHEIEKRIRHWLGRVQEIGCDASAWVFPAHARNVQEYNGFYPGVVLLIKEV